MRGALADGPLARAEAIFRGLAAERLATLQGARERLMRGGPDEGPARDQIAATVHKIGGTAATLGFARLGQDAARVERLMATNAPADAILPALKPVIDGLAMLGGD